MEQKFGAPNLDVIQTKYLEQNPIARYANRVFLETVDYYLNKLDYSNIFDAGCGEGIVFDRIPTFPAKDAFGLDLDSQRLQQVKNRRLVGNLMRGSISELPIEKNSIDFVLVLEVLEHVTDPELALDELARVCRKYMLLSVPHEPFWRMANMARLKYLRDWGNTPEHINHWSAPGFRRFISRAAEVIEIRLPFLWTFILAAPTQ